MKSYRRNIFLSIGILSCFISLGIAHNFAAIPDDGSTLKPTPGQTVTPTPTPHIQTLDDLRSKIRARMLSPEVQRGRIGVKIVSLSSGKVVFENDPDKYFMPASNMKIFTVAAAFERLGPDFRFVTSVYANAKPDASGTVNGDLRIFGRGDVSISTAFNNGDYYMGLDHLVDKIAAAGVKRIEGSIIGDESYFKGFAVPESWEWDDLQWYDGAEISALPINNNSVDLNVKPGAKNGPCLVTVQPQNTLMQIVDLCTTAAAGTESTLKVFKPLGRNILEISGTMPAGGRDFTGYIAITHPSDLFVELLRQRLILKGIVVTGNARTIWMDRSLPPKARSMPSGSGIEIAKLESPPFREIAAKTLKPSQNMFTETILWALGEQIGRTQGSGQSAQLGIDVVKSFNTSIGIPADAILQRDGSGMSRHDLITPSAVVALYSYMAKQSRNALDWRDSLSIGGVDGTLRNRFRGTAAAGNLRGKTGTLDQVSALSGYLTTRGGDQVILSILVNDIPDLRTRVSMIDDIAVMLANYNGKLD